MNQKNISRLEIKSKNLEIGDSSILISEAQIANF